MPSPDPAPGFRSSGTALIRAAARSPSLPPWPDLTDPAPESVVSWVAWLRQVWAIDGLAEALEHASPALANQVRTLCTTSTPAVRDTRRAVTSVARYLLRVTGRATPFGLFAGVALASFSAEPHLYWGGRHHAVARAGAEWLADVVAYLEGHPELLARLPVVANTTLTVRGSRLIVPYRMQGPGPVETSLRHTAAVRAAIDAARAPIRLEDLETKVCARFPAAPPAKVCAMLTELVAQGALITSLRAPSTSPDALAHLLEQLKTTEAATVGDLTALITALQDIHRLLEQHNEVPASQGGALREEVATRMRRLTQTEGHPVAMDLRLDAQVVLPEAVAREVERAALLLTRLSPYPYATPAWRAYHQRFYERFGLGAMVSLPDVVSDGGIGWPDGYPGTVTAEQQSPTSSRDEGLLALAQGAALDGRQEVELDEELIAALELGTGPLRPPPHLEVGVRIYAASQETLQRGDFRIEVVTVSRAAGVMTGRFLPVLQEPDRAELAAALSNLPGGDHDTVAAHLSFPPLDPASTHVTRAPQTLPIVISLAEHRTPGEQVLTPADLAVACDGRRMYLAAPALGQRLEATAPHALNLQTHTPPLARFLTELNRAQCAQVMTFQWGAAERLPFLPRLRVGRTILSPARWRLEAAELPGRAEPWTTWDDALLCWRIRRRLPQRVYLAQGDRRLPLDMNVAAHRALLRSHLRGTPYAVLVEAPAPDAARWFGGRAHEVVVPLTATRPPRWPHLPKPTTARVVGLGQGQAPAASRVLLAALYGNIVHQDIVLAEHLPDLLDRLGQPAAWWYIRYRDPDHHLRLRLALPDADAFGPAAQTISTWASELHRGGLLREVTYPTSYRETGRWGGGAAIDAAEAVFGADSRALLAQLRQPARPHRQALVAAHTVAIAAAFTGSVAEGMRWLIDHVPAAAPDRIARPVFSEAVRIANPADDWAALRTAPGGAAIVEAWQPRDEALDAYRTHLSGHGPDVDGIDVDDVLGSLMHVNFVRACGIDFDDEKRGMYLARAAALAWRACTYGGRP